MYVVLEEPILIKYLMLDLYTKKILYFLIIDSIQRKYLINSIKTIKQKLNELRDVGNEKMNYSNSFNYI